METKPFYLSKTFWINVLALVAIMVPASASFIQANFTEAGVAWVVINLVLRAVSKDKLVIN